jgi:hypothetical protein
MVFHFIAIISGFNQYRVFASLDPLLFESELRFKWLSEKRASVEHPLFQWSSSTLCITSSI